MAAFLALLIPAVLASVVVAAIMFPIGRAAGWSWFVLLGSLPILYVCWLATFLALDAAMITVIGRRISKPRYLRLPSDGSELPKEVRGTVAAALLMYRSIAIVQSLPLLQLFEFTSWYRKVVLRCYGPSSHFGARVKNLGLLYDPDLTYLGDDVVIGAGARIAAHSFTVRAGQDTAYVSAPVRIGDRATIGGESRIALGCEIGHDAIVEPGSIVPAFTRIPPGEVWGGNPARLSRLRDDLPQTDNDSTAPVVAEAIAEASDGLIAAHHAAPAPETLDEELDRAARELVIDALNLTPETTPDELSSARCPTWDSLGQIAIATALYDRYGRAVDETALYRLRSLADVAALISGAAHPPHADEASPSPVPASPASPASPPLPDDLELLPLLEPQQATRALAAQLAPAARSAGTPLHVVVAASFTAQPLAHSLQLWGAAYGYAVTCAFADYNQLVQTLLDPASPFAANRDGVNVLLTRPEDFPLDDLAQATAQVDQLGSALAEYLAAGRGAGQLLVGTLPPLVSAFVPPDPATLAALRAHWDRRLRAIPALTVFDFAGVVERLGTDAARNSAGEVLLRAPYSPALAQALGIALLRQLRAARRSPAKVIALDCDNTLWGGVVGELGLDGIALGPDGAGRAFQLFQQQLKGLKERGLLLVVVSRNQEQDVREVFAQHPGMLLRPDDIAAWAVNWRHKSENLRELAAELNLGLDAFVLLDDDPAVRHEVASRLPQVHVVPLPPEPERWGETLARLWLFDGAQATAVDAARTRMIQEEGRRTREQRSSASLDEFLASLALRVELGPPREADWGRVAQLTQRTNQFSLSLRRRTLEEVRQLGPDVAVLTLQAADRFGDYGLVGVGIGQPGAQAGDYELDTFLMSCRALGRGIEDAFLSGLAELAVRQGARRLVAPYVPGPRNQMLKDYLVRVGFQETAPNRWVLPLDPLPPLPPHVDLRRSDPVAALGD